MIIFLSAFTASSNLFLIFYYTNAVNSPVLIFPRLCLNPAPLYVRFSKEKRSASFRLPTELVKYKILIKYNPKYTESCETIHHLNVLQLPPFLQSAPFHTGVLRSCNLKAGW